MLVEQVDDPLEIIEFHEWLIGGGRHWKRTLKTSLGAMMGDENIGEKHHVLMRHGLDDVLDNFSQNVRCFHSRTLIVDGIKINVMAYNGSGGDDKSLQPKMAQIRDIVKLIARIRARRSVLVVPLRG